MGGNCQALAQRGLMQVCLLLKHTFCASLSLAMETLIGRAPVNSYLPALWALAVGGS